MPRRNTGARLHWRVERNCYEIIWFDGGRRCRKTTGTADRREAETALGDWLHRRDRQQAGPRDPSEIRIADVMADYAEARAHITSADRIGYAIPPLLDFWTGTADSITPDACQRYGRVRARATDTVRRELGILQAALHYAFRQGRMSRQVFVELPPKSAPRDRWLTRSDVARLIRAARLDRRSDHLTTFIMVALYTGGRKGAILDLRWPSVDLDAGVIRLQRDRETGKPRAVVPIPKPLGLYLAPLRRRHSPTGFVVSRFGKPCKDIKKGFAAAAGRAGLADVTPHTLRHTCATWQRKAGVDLKDIGDWLGHRDSRTTQRYAHHGPEFLRRAKEAME